MAPLGSIWFAVSSLSSGEICFVSVRGGWLGNVQIPILCKADAGIYVCLDYTFHCQRDPAALDRARKSICATHDGNATQRRQKASRLRREVITDQNFYAKPRAVIKFPPNLR